VGDLDLKKTPSRVKQAKRALRAANPGMGVNVGAAIRMEKGINVSSYSRKGEEDGVLLRGCDVIAVIDSGSVLIPTGTEIHNQDISPLSFPNSRLKILGGIFQRYRFKNISVEYEHSCPTTTAGQFLHYIDYDPSDSYSPVDGSFAAVQIASAHKGAVPFGVYENRKCFFRHDDPQEALYVQQTGEIRLFTQGKYHLFCVTPPPVNTSAGVLYLKYDIELFQMALTGPDADTDTGASVQQNYASIPSLTYAGGSVHGYAFGAAIWNQYPNHGAGTVVINEDATEDNYIPGGNPSFNWQGAWVDTGPTIPGVMRFPRLGRWRVSMGWQCASMPNITSTNIISSTPTSGITPVVTALLRSPVTSVVGANFLTVANLVFDVTSNDNSWGLLQQLVGVAVISNCWFTATHYIPFSATLTNESLFDKLRMGTISYEDWQEKLRKKDHVTGPHISKYLVPWAPNIPLIESEKERKLSIKRILDGHEVPPSKETKEVIHEKRGFTDSQSESRPHWLLASEGHAPQRSVEECYKRYLELKERLEKNTHSPPGETDSDDEDSIIEEAGNTYRELKADRRRRREEKKEEEQTQNKYEHFGSFPYITESPIVVDSSKL